MSTKLVAIVALGVFVVAGYVHAGVDPAAFCKDAKAKAAGKKASHLLKTFGKNAKNPNAARLEQDVSKAQSKFTRGFTKAEGRGGCLTSEDSDAIEAKVDLLVCQVVDSVGPATCGNNCAGVDEECDGTDKAACPTGVCLGDCTCAPPTTPTTTSTTTTQPPTTTTVPVTTTTTSSTTTTTLRFVDNGDGTITDNQTGLMWEKKDSGGAIPNPANLHDVDNYYAWAGCCDGDCGSSPDYLGLCQPNAAAAAACNAQTGGAVGCAQCASGTCDVDPLAEGAVTTIWDWLVQLNSEGASGFAGHSDWRLPSEEGCNSCLEDWQCPCDPAELESILLGSYPCGTSPCIDPIFGSSASYLYWSGSTSSSPPLAWSVSFGWGDVNDSFKYGDLLVRAVRDGSSTTTSTTTTVPASTTAVPSSTTTITASSTTTTTLRFVGNGDGTITDNQTGLMWEKKSNDGSIHDMDRQYIWGGCCDGTCGSYPDYDYCQPNAAAAAACSSQTGGAEGCSECSVGTCETWGSETIWEWIGQVNAEGGSGFAGHSDWRLPSEDGCNDCWTGIPTYSCPCEPAELETIPLEPYYCDTHPCVDPVFNTSCTGGCTVTECSCTASFSYWSSTTSASNPARAWGVDFGYGSVTSTYKSVVSDVRAVRGGS